MTSRQLLREDCVIPGLQQAGMPGGITFVCRFEFGMRYPLSVDTIDTSRAVNVIVILCCGTRTFHVINREYLFASSSAY